MPHDRINILLVDDRPENLVSLEAILAAPDYCLVKAESGPAALKELLEREFALILLDVQMPGMDGFETAKLIKQREKTKHVPIIFITALSHEAPFLFRGYNVGAVDYVVKPFDPGILRSKVSVFADLYRKTRQLERQAEILRLNERLQHEKELARMELASLKKEQRANEKYRDLVDGITDGIVWIADPDRLNFTFVSAQARRILGSDCGTKVFTESLSECLKRVEDKTEVSFVHPVEAPTGETLWFRTGVKLAGCAEGRELRGLSVDITSLRRAHEKAQEAIRVREQFLSIASHELKTPLTPLCLQLEILQKMVNAGSEPELISERLASSMGLMYRQTRRLDHLIDRLLDVSRINNGKLLLETQEVCLTDLVREVGERYLQEVKTKGASLEVSSTEKILGNWDRIRIEQVVTNLLTNAIKYGEGKPIFISVGIEKDSAVLRVRDQGIGISKSDQERIFQLFERAVTPNHVGGLGLGLYIVRQIVEAHGGSIQVDSEEKKGTTFTVCLPNARVVKKVLQHA